MRVCFLERREHFQCWGFICLRRRRWGIFLLRSKRDLFGLQVDMLALLLLLLLSSDMIIQLR